MASKDKMKIIEEAYKKRYGEWGDWASSRTNLVCGLLGKDKNFKSILDGAGYFPTSCILAEAYPDAKIITFNLFEDDTLHEFYSNIEHAKGDLTKLNYPENHFDLVYLGEVIEHIYDLPACFDGIKKVLKPNGYLAITTNNLASYHNRIELLFGKCPSTYDASPISHNPGRIKSLKKVYGDIKKAPLHEFHIRVFTIDLLFRYLRSNGFEIVRYKTFNQFSSGHRMKHLRRFLNLILPPFLKENVAVIAKNLK